METIERGNRMLGYVALIVGSFVLIAILLVPAAHFLSKIRIKPRKRKK